MLPQLLMIGLLTIAVIMLWRIAELLARLLNDHSEAAIAFGHLAGLIRAGQFVATRMKEDDGWPQFQEMTHHIVQEYIARERLESRE